ncbi:MAG: Vms1/Ankzf1 family peptidyl-tRNA hydrolase [Halovenus sp.]
MFDDLLGRTELKDRIADLEERKGRLEQQLEAEQDRRAEATTEKQEAERRANRLEDRIEQLEDRIDTLDSAETALTYRRETRLEGRRADEILDRLRSVETNPQGAFSAYVPGGNDIPLAVREAFGDRTALVTRAAPCLALTDDAGLVGACLRPPVAPEPFTEWDSGFRVEESWFRPRGRYTLALVRSDLFAMGTYQGDERTAFHGFDSALKSQHSKGGFSQARFERLRDEQIDDHLDRCLAALDEREGDRLYVVGERSVLGEVMHLADATATVDATGDPEDALREAWKSFWTVPLRVV